LELEKARSAIQPTQERVDELETSIQSLSEEVKIEQTEITNKECILSELIANTPNGIQAENEMYASQELVSKLERQAGSARQKVDVLQELKQKRDDYMDKKEANNQKNRLLKILERSFSKDGVPALLIEQALPQIETKANEILARLSNDEMYIRFITQAGYKDKKRTDLKETLDIQINDNSGSRNYEMFSGGEAFRINFAIRLALSEILAHRAGSRLQTLVIDEGFGSQDTQGREKLIEAINLIKGDFAKIFIITHIDELKDIFPHRIEVVKTHRGSQVTIV